MDNYKRIPKAQKVKQESDRIPILPEFKIHDNGLKFSFEALEKTEYFSLDGTCQNWAEDLFTMLKDISGHSVTDMVSGEYKRKYRVHNHEGANPPSKLPAGVALKDCYQIRISTSKGGIHGVFIENIFYIIWLDPLHNMYPDDRYGGLRKVKQASTCCKDRDEELYRMKQEVEAAKDEAKTWEELALSYENSLK